LLFDFKGVSISILHIYKADEHRFISGDGKGRSGKTPCLQAGDESGALPLCYKSINTITA